MLVDETIQIKIMSRSYKYYKKLNYNFDSIGDIITIKTMDLPKQSKHVVRVKCDVCGKIKEVRFTNYIKNIKKYNYYTCTNKCAIHKAKKTRLANKLLLNKI
jgi:hypothetical protein